MSFTGLSLCLFLLTHMAGNLLLLAGPDVYNTYAHNLVTNPLLIVAELGLIALFLTHVVTAIKLTRENRAARGSRYAIVEPSGRSWRSIFSKHMIVSGLIIFVFLIFHLKNFKYGTHYTTTLEGEEVRDLARLVIEEFRQPLYLTLYVAAMLVVGGHLIHGVRSSFQTLGINHPKYNCLIAWVSRGYTVLIVVGFIAVPLSIYFGGIGS